MKVLETFLYSIAHNEIEASEITIYGYEDVSGYFDNVIKETLKNPNKKRFKIRDKNTQVISIFLKSLVDGLNIESSKSIANRLLRTEKEQQKIVDKLNVQIKRGSLFISLIENGDYYTGILVKVDNGNFLSVDDKTKKSGLPYENKSYKECIINISKADNEVKSIYLFDRNGKISDYWSNKFLELDEYLNDEDATVKSFDIINKKLKRYLDKESPSDYILLRNQSMGYFNTQKHFNIDEYFEYVFGKYESENEDINFENIKASIKKEIPDTSFDIVSSAIKGSKKKIIKEVNDIVEINIRGYDNEIRDRIKAIEHHGKKFIEIETTNDETFNSFKWS